MHLGKSGINAKFWRHKKVLITGHTGFKGSWLSLWLQKLEANLVGYALASPTQPNLFALAQVASGMKSITGDIRDFDNLNQTIKEHKPEIIFHLAAQPLVQYSYQNPIETYATNVMGTVHLFEAARNCDSVKVIVNITSDKCYENREWDWGYRENDAMGGYDPYSNSKGCAELVTNAYRNSFFNPEHYHQHGKALASARSGNIIGGGDWGKNRLITDLISAFSRNETVYLRHPEATRPWQYILDSLSGYLLLAEKLWQQPQQFAQGWNFGPNEDAYPVKWIADKMAKMWGHNASWDIEKNSLAHEAQFLKLDTSKARKKLGWSTKVNLEQALTYTVNWYKAWQQQQQDLRQLTLLQIQDYENINQ